MKTFTITEDHLKLLKRMYVDWDDCEFGAPAINCKRPYGNSDVLEDIAQIIGVKKDGDEDYSFSLETANKLKKLHKQTETALQICLVVGEFKTGKYKMKEEYDDTSWERI